MHSLLAIDMLRRSVHPAPLDTHDNTAPAHPQHNAVTARAVTVPPSGALLACLPARTRKGRCPGAFPTSPTPQGGRGRGREQQQSANRQAGQQQGQSQSQNRTSLRLVWGNHGGTLPHSRQGSPEVPPHPLLTPSGPTRGPPTATTTNAGTGRTPSQRGTTRDTGRNHGRGHQAELIVTIYVQHCSADRLDSARPGKKVQEAAPGTGFVQSVDIRPEQYDYTPRPKPVYAFDECRM
jgi:hypothetical protein